MIKIMKHELTQKDVKNEGCSQDVIETKGREYTNFGNYIHDFLV
jgi:hypothetical protein